MLTNIMEIMTSEIRMICHNNLQYDYIKIVPFVELDLNLLKSNTFSNYNVVVVELRANVNELQLFYFIE
jgi:hypothetical protein